jgi:hypothetical protein
VEEEEVSKSEKGGEQNEDTRLTDVVEAAEEDLEASTLK